MNGFKQFILWACGLILLVVLIIGIFFGRDIYEMVSFFHETSVTMGNAKEYMDSLTDKDIQAWIQRTEKKLKKDNPTDFTTADAPPDLQRLGMTGIEEDSNRVVYVWLGGMDSTALLVERISNENFQVTAIYTPYSNRVIWPKP